MLPENMKVYARRSLWNWQSGVDIALVEQDKAAGTVALVEPLVVKKYMKDSPEAYGVTEPAITLSVHQAQMLMDELWTCGLRPSEGSGSAGALAAVERHLADMRKLVPGLIT